ncbi:MAG: hypothetical protein ABI210_11365 [Abditibacteriaceae bacterium]
MKITVKVLLTCLMIMSAVFASHARASLALEQVPTFQMRFQVLRIAGQNSVAQKFSLGITGWSMTSAGNQWSDWLDFDRAHVEQVLKFYPNPYLKHFPVVIKLQLNKVEAPAVVNAEIKWDEGGAVVPLHEELGGPVFGLMLWRGADNKLMAGSMADYNQQMIWSKIPSKPLDAVPNVLFDPTGKQIDLTKNLKPLVLVDVPHGTDCKVWAIHRNSTDTNVQLLNAPTFFSFSPETLLVPEDAR